MKQGRTPIVFICLAGLAGAAAAAGQGGKAHFGVAPSSTPASASDGHHGNSGRRVDPRNPPPLAADRKVSEQDCTKPVDLTRGNLKCK